jgi:integrase
MAQTAKPQWHKKANLWYANIGPKDNNGRRTEVYAPGTIERRDEGSAWRWFYEAKARQDAAETPIAPRSITVEQFCQLYLKHAENLVAKGKLTREHYRSKAIHVGHLSGHYGGRIAAQMTTHDVEDFIGRMQEQGCKPNYVANICSTVSAAFNWGKRMKHWPESPVKGFSVPPVPIAPERFASRDEAATWLRFLWRRTKAGLAASRYDRIHALMQKAMIRTGARPKELCCLLWTDLKWAGWKTPQGISCAKAIIPASRWKSGDTTGKPRTIIFSPSLTRALRRLEAKPDRHPTHVFVHGRGRGGKGAGEPWKDGSTVSKTVCRLRRELIAIQEKIRVRIRKGAAVEDRERRLAAVEIVDDGDNRLVNYRWRHTAASTLLMMGVDVPTVAELLGTSPEMIYRNYGHLLSDHLEAAAHKLMTQRRP